MASFADLEKKKSGEERYGTIYSNTKKQFNRIYNNLEKESPNGVQRGEYNQEFHKKSGQYIYSEDNLWEIHLDSSGIIRIWLCSKDMCEVDKPFLLACLDVGEVKFYIPGDINISPSMRPERTVRDSELPAYKIGSTILETLENNPEFFEKNPVMRDYKDIILNELKKIMALDPNQKDIEPLPEVVIENNHLKEVNAKLNEDNTNLEAENTRLKKALESEKRAGKYSSSEIERLKAKITRLTEENEQQKSTIGVLIEKIKGIPFFGKRVLAGLTKLLPESRESSERYEDSGAESSVRDKFVQGINVNVPGISGVSNSGKENKIDPITQDTEYGDQ